MKSKIASLTLILVSVVLLLCIWTGWAGDTKALPQQKEYARDFETVWTATIEVLQERGDPIIHSDKANGIITTDFNLEDKGGWRRFTSRTARRSCSQHRARS